MKNEFKVIFSVTNNNPNTIWNCLARKLERQPTNTEVKTEVERILSEAKLREEST